MVLLLALALLRLPQAAAAAPTADPVAIAQARYDVGKRLQARGDHAAALDAFRASLALYDSPNTRLLLARSLVALGRLDEGYAELDRAERVATDLLPQTRRYASTRAAAAQERRELEPRIARVRAEVRSSSAAQTLTGLTVRLDAQALPLGALGLELPLMPGAHTLEASAARHRSAQVALTVTAGERHVVSLVLPFDAVEAREGVGLAAAPDDGAPLPADLARLRAAPPDDAASRLETQASATAPSVAAAETTPYAIGGGLVVAGLGAATFVVSGLLARDAHATLAAGCPEGCDVAALAADGRTRQAVANVGLGIGLTGLLLAGGAWLWSSWTSDGDVDAPSATRASAAP